MRRRAQKTSLQAGENSVEKNGDTLLQENSGKDDY